MKLEMKFHRIKPFTRRLYQRRVNNRWLDDPDTSEPPIELQADNWQAETGAAITFVTPTNNNLYQISDDHQLIIQSLTVTYVLPVEEEDDIKQSEA